MDLLALGGVAASRTSLPPLSVGSGEDGERSSNDGGMSDPRLKVSCRLFFFCMFPSGGEWNFYFSWDIFYIPFKNAGWHQFGGYSDVGY